MRTLVAGAVLALVAGTAACGTEPATAAAGPTPSSVTPADETTRRIAEVEFLRQCTVATVAFADEADITTHLDDRLAAAGFTHQQWKDWHDALAGSPALADQFAEVGAVGCPSD